MSKNSGLFFQPAFLWDGSKRLGGKLELRPDVLIFHFDYFQDSSLELRIQLDKIELIKFYKLYDLVTQGLEISDDKGRKNIFIVNDPKSLKKELENYMK
jgi:hypothetical protein